MAESERLNTQLDIVSEAAVLEYLQMHPEVLIRHPEVVESLRIPHRRGEAVSLVEHQIATLRERNQRLQRRLEQLMQNARANEESNQRLHRLTLSLVECSQIDEVFSTLYQALPDYFQVDAVAVRLVASPKSDRDRGLGEFVGGDPGAAALVTEALDPSKPVCGRFEPELVEFLFGSQASQAASSSLLALGEARQFGVLAIGSRDAERFRPEMGTALLRHLAAIVTRVLLPHVTLE